MAIYLKRFESVELDDSIEYCKDAVDILSENDDSVKVRYKEGYCPASLDHSADDIQLSQKILSKPQTDDDMRCLTVSLSLNDFKHKNAKGYSGNVGFPVIEDNGDIENQITILKYGKSLLNKFKMYSDEVYLQVHTGSITFLIKFEIRDTKVKTEAKMIGLNKSINEYLKDYEDTKTIRFTDNEVYTAFNNPKVKKIYDYLCNYCDEKNIETKSKYYGNGKHQIYSLRFTTSIDYTENNRLTITIPSTKFYYLRTKANIKLPNDIMNLVTDIFVEKIKKEIKHNYDLRTMPKDINISKKDNKIFFEI